MNIENALARYIDYGSNVKLIERSIKMNESGNFIKALVGPRRAGKSSIMLLLMQKLRGKGVKPVFINCEDIDFTGITVNDLDKLENAIYNIYELDNKSRVYLFIDEVQNFPEWPRWLRTLFDENRYNIFVSGSTSELEEGRLPSELRGRALETRVLPFSFKEYCEANGTEYSKYMNPDKRVALIKALSDFLDYGGYPEVIKERDYDLKRALLLNIYTTVIQHDMIEKYKIRKTTEFKLFLNSLFGSACRDFSVSKITRWFEGQGSGISNQTVFNYLAYAESVFLVHLLYPYSKKPKERRTKPKAYPIDSGILGLFENDKGKKFETAVLVELLRRGEEVYYYKSGDADIDFIITRNGKAYSMIQASYSIDNFNTYEREVQSIEKGAKELGCNTALIITFDEEKNIKSKGVEIKIVPLWKWLLGL
jgi:predicted AAA+ superfamily ATPase